MFELLASRARLEIARLLSVRPRTLKELSELVGISGPGVLKHLDKLAAHGMLEVNKSAGSGARKVYSIRGVHVGEFAQGGLTMVKLTPGRKNEEKARATYQALSARAEDAIVERHRVREQTRRILRTMNRLADDEQALNQAVDSLRTTELDRLIIRVALTEESLADAARVLARYYGVPDGRRAIDRAFAKVRRHG